MRGSIRRLLLSGVVAAFLLPMTAAGASAVSGCIYPATTLGSIQMCSGPVSSNTTQHITLHFLPNRPLCGFWCDQNQNDVVAVAWGGGLAYYSPSFRVTYDNGTVYSYGAWKGTANAGIAWRYQSRIQGGNIFSTFQFKYIDISFYITETTFQNYRANLVTNWGWAWDTTNWQVSFSAGAKGMGAGITLTPISGTSYYDVSEDTLLLV